MYTIFHVVAKQVSGGGGVFDNGILAWVIEC